MGTTTTAPAESESRLASTEQVKPTAGPWTAKRIHVHEACVYVDTAPDDDNDAVEVAVVYARRFQDVRSIDRAKVDARLIAAAPELLAAAKRAFSVFKAQGESVRSGNVLAALYAAIRKAEGRTP